MIKRPGECAIVSWVSWKGKRVIEPARVNAPYPERTLAEDYLVRTDINDVEVLEYYFADMVDWRLAEWRKILGVQP